jgi:hypothetical protein
MRDGCFFYFMTGIQRSIFVIGQWRPLSLYSEPYSQATLTFISERTNKHEFVNA